MRPTPNLLASISKTLTTGSPTGLTGLLTHPSPRSTLINLYSKTLVLSSQLPPSSAYRTSLEAVTKSRLAIIEAIKPPGFDAWAAHAKSLVAAHPEAFVSSGNKAADGKSIKAGEFLTETVGSRRFVTTTRMAEELDESLEEWDGEEVQVELEGTRTAKERLGQAQSFRGQIPGQNDAMKWVEEPALEVQQIEEIETKIAAGLIEEVIQVAEGELKLVDIMLKAKVWEELVEKPAQGQWEYFARDTHAKPTLPQPAK